MIDIRDKQFRIWPDMSLSIIIVLFIFLIFGQTAHYGLISFDDGLYVKGNPKLIEGLTLENIIWAFTTLISGNWHPITWISYMIDVELYGMNPGMFHMTNVFIHTTNSLLLFLILNKLSSKKWRSGFVAIIFAIHPLHVESVAWISERKDVLSCFFAFLAIFFYLTFTNSFNAINYLLSFFFFILGLMSKSMLVTLPFIFLLLDLWPMNRIYMNSFKKNKSIIIEKIPFILLSLSMCVITVYAQKKGNAVATLDIYPAYLRMGNIIISYFTYLKKIFYPTNLSILYPRPEFIPASKIILSFCILLLITTIALKTYSQKPYLLIGWFWFLGTLVPVIGIIQIGMQGMADRYMYIPSVGIFISMTWAVFDLCNERKTFKVICSIGGCILIIIYASISYIQTVYWANSIILYNHSLSVTKKNYVLHRFLGDALMNLEQFEKAHHHFSKALEINPQYVAAYNDLGSLYFRTNHYKRASHFFHIGLNINPNNSGLLNNLGVTYAKLDDLNSAIKYFKDALIALPGFLDAKKNLKRAENILADKNTFKIKD